MHSYIFALKTLWVRNIQDGRGLTEFMPMRLSVVYTLSSNTTDYIRYWFTTHNVVNQYSNQQFINCHMLISCQVRQWVEMCDWYILTNLVWGGVSKPAQPMGERLLAALTHWFADKLWMCNFLSQSN